MADLLDFSVERLEDQKSGVPRWRVTGRIVDSVNQKVEHLAFTGKALLTFPDALALLTVEEQDEVVATIAARVLTRQSEEFAKRVATSEDAETVRAALEVRAENSTKLSDAIAAAVEAAEIPVAAVPVPPEPKDGKV